jgi:Amt family ammonium transporter
MAAMALALVLGPRKGFVEKDPMEPNSIPMVVLGAALLWFGWFGFNAGSSLAADGLAVNAFVATNTAAASAAFTWMLLSWFHRRPSVLGAATGAVVGLVAITPAAGFVKPVMGIPIGAIASILSYYVMIWRSQRSRLDESLDVLACHGVGGAWGAIATGIFATTAVNGGGANGLLYGDPIQILKQLVTVLVVATFSFGVSWIIAKLITVTAGLRVDSPEETVGLDISQHGEKAYGGLLS